MTDFVKYGSLLIGSMIIISVAIVMSPIFWLAVIGVCLIKIAF